VCARFLHEIYSCYIPEFDGNLSVAREANRVWPVSLPEETDIFIVNKIVDQLRDLLHRKLMEEDGKIQMLYHQMKHNKRRMSHGELRPTQICYNHWKPSGCRYHNCDRLHVPRESVEKQLASAGRPQK
jgi:hypothetical protein